jgi:NAD(P)-dependent dehydrogenase (short-subunit alcohol dehydrogenase family)
MSWHPSDIGDLSGRRVLVTGANSGLGFHTALELLRRGADVIVAARNPRKAGRAVDLLHQETRRRPDLLELDLADLASVHAAAEQARESYAGIDVLINNAGVMATPERSTIDGFELQVGTNHLGHFALTGLLLPLLEKTAEPRVVTVSSFLHRSVRGIARRDLRGEGRYDKWTAYGRSKLANLLFMYELDRRARAGGSHLTSVGAHPGYASTELQVSGPRLGGVGLQERVLSAATKVFAQPAAAGAWPSLYAATAPELTGGTYVGPRLLGLRGAPGRASTSAAARRPGLAADLWNWSAEATGVDYL